MTKTSRNGLYFDVVNSLTKPLHGTHARIYLDNAYTSIPILILSSTMTKKKKYAQIDFSHKLALGLINNYCNRHIKPQCKPAYIGPDTQQTMVNHVNTHMNVARVQTCRGHWKFEGTNKRTIYGCLACNIFLCKSCHPKWHQASLEKCELLLIYFIFIKNKI